MTKAMPDYEQNLLRRYDGWSVYIHESQAYLGRSYIALNRPGNVDPFTETTRAERVELEEIVAGLRRALDNLYQPDIYNYANLRNTWPHCHWHVIPRYQESRTLGDQEFMDANWGRNYAPYDRNFAISEALFTQIRTDMITELNRA